MPTALTGLATRAHRRTSLAACRLQDQGLKHGPRPSAIVPNFPQPSSPSAIAHARNARAATRALTSSDISLRRWTTRSRLCGNRGPTYVRANSAASSSVRTVTSRARRRDGLNTKSIGNVKSVTDPHRSKDFLPTEIKSFLQATLQAANWQSARGGSFLLVVYRAQNPAFKERPSRRCVCHLLLALLRSAIGDR